MQFENGGTITALVERDDLIVRSINAVETISMQANEARSRLFSIEFTAIKSIGRGAHRRLEAPRQV